MYRGGGLALWAWLVFTEIVQIYIVDGWVRLPLKRMLYLHSAHAPRFHAHTGVICSDGVEGRWTRDASPE